MIKLIIFDWDDVITTGAKEGYYACYHQALVELGISLPLDEERRRIVSKWGKSVKAEMEGLLLEHPEHVDKACEIFEREFWGDTFTKPLQLVEGVNELLLRLKEKYILAVATGNHQKMLRERIMPHFNIPDVFAQIVSSDEFEDQEKTKPHPHMIEVIMEKQNVSPEETVFVGDAKPDVQMAFNAHATPIVALTGHLTRGEAQELGVEKIIEDVTHIESVLI